MILSFLINVMANPINPGGVIAVTDSGAFACLELDAIGDAHDAWVASPGGGESVIILTDEHNFARACHAEDFVAVDCVDQSGSLLDLPVLMEALGDIRRSRANSNCPHTCSCNDY
tara:strand:- start:186 stop:530 length:345 start_codon:yes stop_codon:yes gene_type:complete